MRIVLSFSLRLLAATLFFVSVQDSTAQERKLTRQEQKAIRKAQMEASFSNSGFDTIGSRHRIRSTNATTSCNCSNWRIRNGNAFVVIYFTGTPEAVI